jgi:hypothetical protein
MEFNDVPTEPRFQRDVLLSVGAAGKKHCDGDSKDAPHRVYATEKAPQRTRRDLDFTVSRPCRVYDPISGPRKFLCTFPRRLLCFLVESDCWTNAGPP